MRFLLRNLHVFVFVSLSASIAFWVASHSDQAVEVAQPLVEDAVELHVMAENALREIGQLDLEKAADEAISYYVATLRMPSLLFERLSDELGEVSDTMEERVQSRPFPQIATPAAKDRPAPVGTGPSRYWRTGEDRHAKLSI